MTRALVAVILLVLVIAAAVIASTFIQESAISDNDAQICALAGIPQDECR